MPPEQAVADLLQAAGAAHHTAFAHVDGADPEWAAWYANHLLPDLASTLDATITHEDLAAVLARFDANHRANPTDEAWHASYARQLIAHYAG